MHVFDKDKSGLKGKLDIPVASLLREVSCYFRSPTFVRTFAVSRASQEGNKSLFTSKGTKAAPLSPILGTVTVTFMFSSDEAALHEYVPGFGKVQPGYILVTS